MKKKTKKFALIFFSVILALCLAFTFVACGDSDDSTKNNGPEASVEDPLNPGEGGGASEDPENPGLSGDLSDDDSGEGGDGNEGGITPETSSKNLYVNMAYEHGTKINVAIGYNNSNSGMFYGPETGTEKTFVGGYQAANGVAKPVTQVIEDELDVTLVDKYEGNSTSRNLSELVYSNYWGNTVDIASTDLSVAAEEAEDNDSVLNLADYLQYMPNFAVFLKENPVVYMSLLQSGMDTETGEGQKLYIAPYFSGKDDIEKEVMMRQDWVEDVLDFDTWTGSTSSDSYGASDDTFRTACYAVTSSTDPETAAYGTLATSYMGTTGSWSIVSTAEPEEGAEANGDAEITVEKKYDDALDAARDQNTPLGTAYLAIAGDAYAGESGNIVDIMNSALNSTAEGAKGLDATGEDLAELYRAYIAAAYTVGGTQYYGTSDVPYSKVFTGYSACWDVDDLVALLRIIKCSSGQVGLDYGQKTTGIFPRDYTNNRAPDIISLVGELYGCRGTASRYESTYIDSDGVLRDARADEKFWDSLEAFGGLAAEGLVESGYILDGQYNSIYTDYISDMHGTTAKKGVGFMQWDWSHYQSTQLFDGTPDEDHNYGFVNTPVSLWDDGTTVDSGYSYTSGRGKYMRFSESYCSTKIAGVAVAASVAEDENKLAACLAFIDYLYSAEGQITTTYGMQSTNGNTNPNGTWYGNPVSGSLDVKNVCDVTTQWIVKEGYRDEYVVNGGKICTKDGEVALDENGEELPLAVYAENESYARYSVKEEYKSEYFTYGGELYTGTYYKGEMTPTITDEIFAHFTATSSESDENGAEVRTFSGVRESLTNFARYILGSYLPISFWDLSFENQMTAEPAREDAMRVSVSYVNGTINHLSLDFTENMFYTCVPTGLPLTSLQQDALNDYSQNTLRYETGTAYAGSNFFSIYHWIIWFGYTGTYAQNNVSVNFSSLGITDSATMIEHLNGLGLRKRISILDRGWGTCLEYWAYLK